MNLASKFAVAAAMTLAAPAAFAATPLFTDSLQGTLANGNWAGNSSGQIVAAPGGGSALNFASLGTGSDLTSILFGSAGAGIYRVRSTIIAERVNAAASSASTLAARSARTRAAQVTAGSPPIRRPYGRHPSPCPTLVAGQR
ncbi:MAG: hypothetical protein JWR80_10196 [Bradyrhizobium sp.]|nr:hypothetical protein [Bradyrhizobium sp.]